MWKFAFLLIMVSAYVESKDYQAVMRVINISVPIEVPEISLKESNDGYILTWNTEIKKGSPPLGAVLILRHLKSGKMIKTVVDDVCDPGEVGIFQHSLQKFVLNILAHRSSCPIPKETSVKLTYKLISWDYSVDVDMEKGDYDVKVSLQFPRGAAYATALFINVKSKVS